MENNGHENNLKFRDLRVVSCTFFTSYSRVPGVFATRHLDVIVLYILLSVRVLRSYLARKRAMRSSSLLLLNVSRGVKAHANAKLEQQRTMHRQHLSVDPRHGNADNDIVDTLTRQPQQATYKKRKFWYGIRSSGCTSIDRHGRMGQPKSLHGDREEAVENQLRMFLC